MKQFDLARGFALVIGIVFLLVGILGFILNPTEGALLGIFAVNIEHNLIHLLVGILGIAAAFTGWPRLYAQILGIVYLLVGILGFIPGLAPDGMLLGLVHINLADNLLHLIVGAAAAIVGFLPVGRQALSGESYGRAR
ncbi:MAG: DUF4383 domain-containing protein [Thermogemmatispora sp.]|jgi:hypothetical protein|uniref:Membrane protein n=1 Tax=Thermogemmatispora aurantia TaxID=2045279 RepID=A0A5J4K4R1_9CHLR|nr:MULTISPECIES: DUF4383 domain-containing protein [Thermogemmatispora]MBE3564834.1 DUF4383 domain-containing protein [Thermogemmatispora sp.]GER82062.1 membrane protein [Thermogemmatispora aurantia]